MHKFKICMMINFPSEVCAVDNQQKIAFARNEKKKKNAF